MISAKYDFDEFVKAVKDLPRREIIARCREESRAVDERSTGGVRGAPAARKAGARKYETLLGRLIYFLEHNEKPGGVDSWDFLRMRPIIESLVKRGEAKPEDLIVFAEDLK